MVYRTARGNLDKHSRNAETDTATLSMMPALAWIDTGNLPLYAPFAGTVHGGPSTETATTCRQPAVTHCLGLAPPDDASCGHIHSMKSWTCVYVEEQISSALALKFWDINL